MLEECGKPDAPISDRLLGLSHLCRLMEQCRETAIKSLDVVPQIPGDRTLTLTVPFITPEELATLRALPRTADEGKLLPLDAQLLGMVGRFLPDDVAARLRAEMATDAAAAEAARTVEVFESAEPPTCHADRDGGCSWSECPQVRDGEPYRSGRHCPIAIPTEELEQ